MAQIYEGMFLLDNQVVREDWNRAKEEYGPDKFTIRRYQKRNGEYQQKSKFNISSPDQAQQLIAALNRWLTEQ